MVQRIKLGELLVRAGVLDEARLKAALHEQERWGGRLGATLVSMGFVAEDILVKALSKQLAVPIARLDQLDVPESVLEKIDLDFAKTHGLVPERYFADKRTLVVAMADPINVTAIDEISRRTGCRIQPTVGGERAINYAITQLYGADMPELATQGLMLDNLNEDRFTDSPPGPPGPPARPGAPPSGPPQTNTGFVPGPSMAPPSGAQPSLPDLVSALELAQKKQLKAIRAMAELLIEKGVISKDEYVARLGRRGPSS
ncbi:MAG: hypothetical protein U1E65_31670 [Myxococcota bacterium]